MTIKKDLTASGTDLGTESVNVQENAAQVLYSKILVCIVNTKVEEVVEKAEEMMEKVEEVVEKVEGVQDNSNKEDLIKFGRSQGLNWKYSMVASCCWIKAVDIIRRIGGLKGNVC